MKPISRNMTIAEMTRHFGVTARSLRFYEELDLLNPARHGNRRVYRPSDQRALALIMVAVSHGLTLKEIRRDYFPGDEAIIVPHRMLADRVRKLEKASKDALRMAATIQQTLLASSGAGLVAIKVQE